MITYICMPSYFGLIKPLTFTSFSLMKCPSSSLITSRFRCTLKDLAGLSCGHAASRAEGARHRTADCPHRPVDCECGMKVPHKDMEVHYEVCEKRGGGLPVWEGE